MCEQNGAVQVQTHDLRSARQILSHKDPQGPINWGAACSCSQHKPNRPQRMVNLFDKNDCRE
uniref:Uncharacterized protein n=1 Tax=Arion vulgaris TaxID=1028688 RepID=A0A0B6Z5D1_9EUPU